MDAELDDDKDSRFEFMAKLFAQMLMHLLIYPFFIEIYYTLDFKTQRKTDPCRDQNL